MAVQGSGRGELTERDERVVEDVARQDELHRELCGRVLAGLKEGEDGVPYGALSHNGVDQRARVEVLHAQVDRRAVRATLQLRCERTPHSSALGSLCHDL